MAGLGEHVRWAIAIALASVFLTITFANWWIAMRRLRGGASTSWIPLVAGAAGALAVLVAPVAGLGSYWWVPFAVDWGSLPGALVSLGALWLRRV